MRHQFTPDQVERFWNYVAVSDECWLWNARRDRWGYGHFTLRPNKKILAHRMMYALVHGELPDGKQICHHCDNPSCVRPSHLWAGTASENRWDASQKQRLPKGEAHHWYKGVHN